MRFNRGSGGSPVRMNRLPQGFTPASLRCLGAMEKESWGMLCRTACGHSVRDKAPIDQPRQRHRQRQRFRLATWPTSSH